MKKGKKLYEGKAKIIYPTQDKDLVIQYFKDDATAFNNQKKTTIEGKPAARIGDPISCGDAMGQGASKTFFG